MTDTCQCIQNHIGLKYHTNVPSKLTLKEMKLVCHYLHKEDIYEICMICKRFKNLVSLVSTKQKEETEDSFLHILHTVYSVIQNKEIQNIKNQISKNKNKNKFLNKIIKMIFVFLKLSKSQQDIMNRVINVILYSIGYEEFINCSYCACCSFVEKQKQNIEKQNKKRIEDSLLFSITYDTSPFFKNNYLLVYFKTLSKNTMEIHNFPIIIDYCTQKKGCEIYQYLTNNIKCDWKKCICITSDGASANMSPKNGTNYLLCSYVNNRKQEDIQTHLSLKVTQSIWCFCHRIQLSSKELALHNFPKKNRKFY